MKKINFAILALALLTTFLAYTVTETKVGAQDSVSCRSLSGCCGAAGCAGPGRPSGCSIECDGGGSVTCCSNTSGKCRCGLQ